MNNVYTIDAYWITFLAGLVIPLATDVLTKRFTNGWPKAVCLVGLAALTAVVQDVARAGNTFTARTLLSSFVLALVTAFTAHRTLFEPLHVTGDAGLIQKATGGFGLGTPAPAPAPAPARVDAPAPERVYTPTQAEAARAVMAAQLKAQQTAGYARGGPVDPHHGRHEE